MPETTDLPQITTRRRNWAPWIGLLLALLAMLSNGVYFLELPGQRALPILGVALVIAALVCAAAGILRTFRQPQRYGGKVSSSILGVVSLLLCVLAAFASMHSRDLPEATGAPQVGQKVPDFTLAAVPDVPAVFDALDEPVVECRLQGGRDLGNGNRTCEIATDKCQRAVT